MNIADAVFNWLQIYIVAEARPNDRAAQETAAFFESILREDHQLKSFEIDASAETYQVRYVSENGEENTLKFHKQSAEKLLKDIEAEPRYNQ